MANDREDRKNQLFDLIESIDSGVIQVTIYRGMPVKIRLVSNEEIVIGGGTVDKLNTVEWFSQRNWWKKE